MHRPLPPMFFVGVFLLVVIAAVLMLAQVMSQQPEEPRSTPRAAVALQLALVQQGDAVGLRLTCVESLRASITEVAVRAAQATWAGKTIDELVGAIENLPDEAEKQQKLVKTPAGEVLTRLVLVSGEWQAETPWFFGS